MAPHVLFYKPRTSEISLQGFLMRIDVSDPISKGWGRTHVSAPHALLGHGGVAVVCNLCLAHVSEVAD